MSIYRNADCYPRSDTHGRAAADEGLALAPWRGTSQIDIELDQHQRLRKATPINRPLLRTLMWVADLPHSVRPTALLRRYARIANLIAAAWGDRKCFHVYMESLFTDNRGNRRGFPPDVLSELIALQRYYDTRNDYDSAWATVGKRR
jgi:hypothetical protein